MVAARMTESGRHIVVLDGAPPFVKVFGRDGGLRAAFAGRGRGPGEVEAPAALATSGDTAVLVVDARGGLSVFDLAGHLKAHSGPLGIVPLAAAAGCWGGWTLYGPSVTARGTPLWLHHVRLADGSAVVRSALPDSIPSQGIGLGLAYGLIGGGDALVLRHDEGRAVYASRCASAPELLFRLETREPAGDIASVPGRQVTRVRPGTRIVAGIARVSPGVLTANVVVGGGTELTLYRSGSRLTRRLGGAWYLRDSGPEGVLVSTDDPAPRIYLLRPAAFERLFSQS